MCAHTNPPPARGKPLGAPALGSRSPSCDGGNPVIYRPWPVGANFRYPAVVSVVRVAAWFAVRLRFIRDFIVVAVVRHACA